MPLLFAHELGHYLEKRTLEQRLSFALQELEKTRANVPRGISTS